MEEVREEVKEEINLVTEGGYSYIESNEGLKVRNAFVNRRIKEDGETFEEYKMRQKFLMNFRKESKKGKWFWKSQKQPSKELMLKVNLNVPGVLESDEFLQHKASNLGTYNKTEVEEFLRSKENNG